jgi:Na+/proline symporter
LATHKCLQPAYISQQLPLETHNVFLVLYIAMLGNPQMLATSLHQSTLAFGRPQCLKFLVLYSAVLGNPQDACNQPTSVNTCLWKPTMSFLCSTVQCLATHNVLATIVLISPHMCTQFFGNPKPTCDCNRCADNCFAAHTCAPLATHKCAR